MKTFNLNLISNSKGFTLLEILIAITLLAFITLGVVSITDNAVITMDRTSEINKNNLQIETALSRLEWDFSQIYSPLYFSTPFDFQQIHKASSNSNSNSNLSLEHSNYLEQLMSRFERNQHFSGISIEGLPIPRFYAPEKDSFEFFTTSNRRKFENTKQSHFAWVKYSLINQVDQEERQNKEINIPQNLKSFVRYFYPDNPYDDERIDANNNKIKAAILLNNVESIEFQFWDPNKKKWENSLRSINQGENILRGLKLLITWYDDSGNKRFIEKIFRTLWPMAGPKNFIQSNTLPKKNSQTTNPDNNESDGADNSGN